MGIGRGRLSPTHLKIEMRGEYPGSAGLQEAIESRQIDFDRSSRLNHPAERNAGWATSSDTDEVRFDNLDLWYYNNVTKFFFREDRKRVDTAAVKRKCNQRISDWLTENNRQRAPVAIKAEIKEQVLAELTRGAPVSARIVELAIDWSAGYAIVSSQSGSSVDQVIKLLNATFRGIGASFSRLTLKDLAGEKIEEAKTIEDVARSLHGNIKGPKLLEDLWRTLEGDEIWVEDYKVTMGERAVLSGADATTTLRGPLNEEEMAAALRDEKSLTSLGLAFTKADEHDFEMTIAVDQDLILIKDLIRPPLIESSDEIGVNILIGMSLYWDAFSLVKLLIQWWLQRDPAAGETEESPD
jgi:putative component of toxin-antitoxin plasmid stabilization module